MLRRCAVALVVGAGFAYAYFYQAGGWNQNSRFDLVRAIVEEHQLAIDDYASNTGDKAKLHGHTFSDKAPGLALTAVPFVAVARVVAPRKPLAWSYIATVATVGLPLALAVAALFFIAIRLGATPRAAGFAAAAWGIGTPVFAYGTLFWGHALSTACLVFAYLFALRVRERPREAILVGLIAGWAVVTEFPAAPAAAILVTLAILNRPHWRVAVEIAAGALAAAAVLLIYQKYAFGSATHVGYSSVEDFAGMKQGFLGVTYPKAHVLSEILFGRFRGLLPLAPVVALGPLGLVLLGDRDRVHAKAAIAAGLIALYYVLFNAAYGYWNGGWSFGPRHLSPALPFLCLGLATVWTRAPAIGRAALGLLAVWGAVMALACVSTTAQPPEMIPKPVGDLLWPAFERGDVSLNPQSFLEADGVDPTDLRDKPRSTHAAWNIGEAMGMHGLASLIPLALVWAVCAFVFVRETALIARSESRRSAPRRHLATKRVR